MGEVFFPLDEEVGFLPGNLAPRQQEHLVHLACFMPFDKAAEMLEVILGVQTNEETARHRTEYMGACMQAAQTAEVDVPCSHEANKEQAPLRCVISSDGAMVSLVQKQWAEVRTLAIGEPQEKRNAQQEREIHVGKLSYFSRVADASSFIDLAEVEMRHRQVREAKQVCAVTDGADWCQSLTQRYRPDAVRILDFPHAAEHVSLLLEGFEKGSIPFPPRMLERCLHILKHRGPRSLLRLADRHVRPSAQQEGESCHLGYLRKREALMHYPQFRQQGWPLGSGMGESANKNVVEARLKGTGMHWERTHVNPMLALRNAVCNDRWREMWQKALQEHRQQQLLDRKERRKLRTPSLLALNHPCSSPPSGEGIPPSSLPPSGTDIPSAPPARRFGFSRASAHRPKGRVTHRDTSPSEQHFSLLTKVEMSAEVCICGNPLVQSNRGGRIRHYCSDRCRIHAYRKRETHWISSLRRQQEEPKEAFLSPA